MFKNKNYIRGEVGNEDFELIVDEASYIPDTYKKVKGWKKTKALFVKYQAASEKSSTLLLEDILIECKPFVSFRNQQRDASSDDYYIVAGIPTARLDWILEKTIEATGKSIQYPYESKNNNTTWVTVDSLLEDEEVVCYAYKQELKRTVSIGSLNHVCTSLKSNIKGFGQFEILITSYGQMDLFLTGFQMVDKCASQSAIKPEMQISPPAEVIKEMHDLSLF